MLLVDLYQRMEFLWLQNITRARIREGVVVSWSVRQGTIRQNLWKLCESFLNSMLKGTSFDSVVLLCLKSFLMLCIGCNSCELCLCVQYWNLLANWVSPIRLSVGQGHIFASTNPSQRWLLKDWLSIRMNLVRLYAHVDIMMINRPRRTKDFGIVPVCPWEKERCVWGILPVCAFCKQHSKQHYYFNSIQD